MLLKNALFLRKDIEDTRKDMYDLVRQKGFNDISVIHISQELDKKITMMQRLIIEVYSSPLENSLKP